MKPPPVTLKIKHLEEEIDQLKALNRKLIDKYERDDDEGRTTYFNPKYMSLNEQQIRKRILEACNELRVKYAKKIDSFKKTL